MISPEPTDSAAAIAHRPSFARSWMLATVMTGVTILSARFAEYIPPTPVPVTLQVFAVLLTGLLLGRRWSAVAQLQYLAIGAVGAPVFAKAGHGPGDLFGLTGGYLLSYPIAAAVTGWITESRSAEGPGLSQLSMEWAAPGIRSTRMHHSIRWCCPEP
jgi:biotin transport system substrate-specific component